MTCIEIVIKGRVQGVGFRQYTVQRARNHGVVGWVQNESDGNVRAHACGDDHALDALTRDLMTGPALARVDGLETRHLDTQDSTFTSFQIKF